jgi:SAM-dependent methyltransferase
MPPTAADHYAERIDAVLEQRTRLRGRPPSGDLFGDLPPDHPLMQSNPRAPADAYLQLIASYIQADDIIVDVGGGAGRISLPLALLCKEVINVDLSPAMGAAFLANAKRAEIENVRFIASDWQSMEPPVGTVALVNNVTYFTRQIVPFLLKLERAGGRRVIITVNSLPPPSRQRHLFELLYGETEQIVPGHAELVNVLWELGRLPEIRVITTGATPLPVSPTRDQAIEVAINRFGGEQWATWPLGEVIEGTLRGLLSDRFEELFIQDVAGYRPTWWKVGPEVLITWDP